MYLLKNLKKKTFNYTDQWKKNVGTFNKVLRIGLFSASQAVN